MPKFNLNPDYLAAAATCISTEESRYYLRGVYVMPKPDSETGLGALMVTTDGYRVALIYDPEGTAERSAILAMNWKSPALKPDKRFRCRVLIDTDTKTAKQIIAGDETETETALALDTAGEIDGTFPDFMYVLPRGEPLKTACEHGWDSAYLASFSAAHKRMTGEKSNLLRMWQTDAEGPAWVTTGEPNARFILMPARFTRDTETPAWLD